MEDGENTYQERKENNLQQKQSEGGVECDETNRAGSRAKTREEQVHYLQEAAILTPPFPLHNHKSIHS